MTGADLVPDLGQQIMMYGVNVVLALIAISLYGGWLWRIRDHWRAIPLGWMLGALLLDRLSVLVNEAYWLAMKAGVGYEILDPVWLGSKGLASKILFTAANVCVIWAYFHARRR